ncbi:nucleotidyltransferase family protein [Pseudovibrio sp. SPO723]|uniref:nucleotidyltransferase family protein n=1 Tax=Nesiotobacter zosterae TaxID=392721 RepID=UPI0029C54776|nr:nucleotidyltransferase family protein [Pseudovibrio sp. SPO723]MDX5592271.1 nucleotidyltransferase family protein [Pseudovibrio sp. SPO723]
MPQQVADTVSQELTLLDQQILADPLKSSEDERRRVLSLLLLTHPGLLSAMKGIRSLGVADWRISGRTIGLIVGSALFGKPEQLGSKLPLHLSYFEGDKSSAGGDLALLRNLQLVLEESPFSIAVENVGPLQSVPLLESGPNQPPPSCTDEAILRSPVQALAVGVRLEAKNRLSIFAPYGLACLFAMKFIENPVHPDEAAVKQEMRYFSSLWPDQIHG